jgi:hypothetical protein
MSGTPDEVVAMTRDLVDEVDVAALDGTLLPEDVWPSSLGSP